MRYIAFISYNYRDRKHATWLHRAIEGYRVPRRLWGRETLLGTVGKRLPPVFRDRDELAASADLGDAVQQALRETQNLVVICSPNAVKSRWVNEEIRTFTALGKRDRIRCLIVDGEPHAADPARECLPPALFDDGGTEPLAADIRKHQDSRSSARLKIIASLLGVPYDELRQREAQRRQRRLAILAAASTIGFVVMAWLAITAFLARNEAVRQRDIARQRTVTAERTTRFVEDMFREADPSQARGDTITAREVLDSGAQRIRSSLADEPAVRTELGLTLGEVYGALGLYREGGALIGWTFNLPHGQPAIAARQFAALADAKANDGEFERASALYQRGIAIARNGLPERPELLPRMLVGLAEARSDLGDYDAATRDAREALALNLARVGPNDPEIARDLEALANNAFFAGRYMQARTLAQRALKVRLATEGPRSAGASDDVNVLGNIAKALGDDAGAERYYRSRLASDERVLGADHPDIATTLNNLSSVLIPQRKYAEAASLMRRALAIDRRERSDDNGDMAFHWSNFALAEQGLGDVATARTAFEAALKPARARDHVALGPILANLAALRCQQGDTQAGLALIAEARPIVARDYPREPWRSAWVESVAASCLLRSNDRAGAATLLATRSGAVLTRWGPDTHYGRAVRDWRRAAGLPS